MYKTAETGLETRARSARVSMVSKVLCIPVYTDTAWYKVFIPCRCTRHVHAAAPRDSCTLCPAGSSVLGYNVRTSRVNDKLRVIRTTVVPGLRHRKRAQTRTAFRGLISSSRGVISRSDQSADKIPPSEVNKYKKGPRTDQSDRRIQTKHGIISVGTLMHCFAHLLPYMQII